MRVFTDKLPRRFLKLSAQLALKLTGRLWRSRNLRLNAPLLLTAVSFLAVAFSILSLRTPPALAASGINTQINFQARLYTNAGAVIPDGNYNIEFKIYCGGNGLPGTTAANCNHATDEQLLWTESRINNNSQGVTVRNGYFSVALGSIASLSSVDFNDDKLWLSLNVGNTNPTCTPFSNCSPDGEMSPFQRFGSNAYAFNSDKLDGLDSTAFGQLSANQTWTGTNTLQPTTDITGLVVRQTSAGSPTADILKVQNSSNDEVLSVTAAGAVALGKTSTTNGVLIFRNSSNANVVTLQSGVTAASGYTLTLPTALGSSGDCIKDTTGAGVLGFGACGGGGGDLQDAYDASPTPAEILLASGKNLVITSPDVATDPNILFNLECTTCSANGGRFAVQSGGTDVLTVNPNGGAVLLQNTADSTAAFKVNRVTTSTTDVLTVDTTNSQTILRGINSTASIGGELLTGNCTGTDWSGTGSGPYTHSSGSASALTCTISGGVTIGDTYQITYTSSPSIQTTQITPAIGGVNGSITTGSVSNMTVVISATGSSNPSFTPNTSADTGTISAISIKKVTISSPVLSVQNSTGTTGVEVRSGGDLANTFVGIGTGRANTSGSWNVANGYYALQANTTGFSNTAIGPLALYLNTEGENNTAIGYTALAFNAIGDRNTAIGSGALYSNTTGDSNTATGRNALQSNTSGSSNAAYGHNALQDNTTGSSNSAFGSHALLENTEGYYNTGIGRDALRGNTSGDYNIGLGFGAGYTSNSSNANTTGNNNTFIGRYAGPGSATQLQNATAIGAHAVVDQNDSLVLGCIASINSCSTGTSIGIGTASPNSKLHVVAGGVCIEQSDSGCAASSGSLTINGPASGDALTVSNDSSTGNIAVFKDGSTPVATIADGGATTLTSVQPASGNGVNTLTVNGGKGSNTATAGNGGNLSLTAGAGGDGSAANGNGGNITVQSGAPGSGGGSAGTYGNLLINTSGGNVGIGTSGTPSGLLSVGGTTGNLTINSSGDLVTSGTLTLSALDCTTNANGGALTADAFGVISCSDDDGGAGGGTSLQAAYTASGTANPQILLNSTNGGIKIHDGSPAVTGNLLQLQNNGGTATYLGISATALTLQDSSGNNALIFDSTTSELKVYANTTSPTAYANIYYDNATSEAVFTASSGVTRIGSGSGNVTIPLTGHTDVLNFSKTYTASAAYSQSEFNIVRNITGGSNALTGNVAKIEDLSTFSGGSSAPNVLYINQNNSGATGNLILAQTGGGANDKFKVSTAGTVTIAAGQSYTGAGALTVAAGASSALTLTGNAASTWSTSTGNVTIQAGGANTVILKPGTDSSNAVQVQNAAGTSMLAFDSSANQIKVGTSDTNGTLLVLDTKTDSGDPTGVNGAMYYNSNAGKFRCYENGAWKDCISAGAVVKSGTVAVTEGTPATVNFTTAFASAPNCTIALDLSGSGSASEGYGWLTAAPSTTSFTINWTDGAGGAGKTENFNWVCTSAANP